MAKNAVYDPIDDFNPPADPEIKRAALLFDKVFVKLWRPATTAKDYIKYGLPKEFCDKIRHNEVCFDYLIEQGVLVPFESPRIPDINSLTSIEWQMMRRSVALMIKGHEEFMKADRSNDPHEQEQGLRSARGLMDRGRDAVTRFCAVRLAKNHSQEFYPILRSTESFDKVGSKRQVVRLLLNHIPQPTADTPWEAIVDFRQDESTRLKYLALMNWINELTISSLTVNELNEKLEYLYLDYKRSVERHRLKATTGILEIITGAAIGFFTSNIPAALNLSSNIVKVGTTVLHLHEEEEKLPGKEIAYIYHANKRFGDGCSPRSA